VSDQQRLRPTSPPPSTRATKCRNRGRLQIGMPGEFSPEPRATISRNRGRHDPGIRTQLSTTAIYANAVGAEEAEEKDIARRMWG
jgi:hypothetical protein